MRFNRLELMNGNKYGLGYTKKGEYHINVYNPKHRFDMYQLLENEGEINKFKLALVNFKEKHPRAFNVKVILS